MNSCFSNLSILQRQSAIQRLTALWAFTESGLGGIMHAFQIPFTGLLVGGMAVIMICYIAYLSEHNYRQILKSAVIVLIVKAMVSPLTPFPAYIAVSFQAILGYALFSLSGVNFINIILLSTISMLESAIQKLLVLTLLFGESLWKAMDKMIAFATGQLGNIVVKGSYWVIGLYLVIYIAGGLIISWLAFRTIQNFNPGNSEYILNIDSEYIFKPGKPHAKSRYKKIWIVIALMIGISVILFLFARDSKQGWVAVARTVAWTLSAITIWFMLIGPLFTKLIQKSLKKKQSRYRDEVMTVLSFLPVLQKLTALAWQQSKLHKGIKRWYFFFALLIYTTLTYSEPLPAELPLNSPA